ASPYSATGARPIPPTPVVGCVGLVPEFRFVPDACFGGDVVLVATAPGDLDLAAEAELIRWTWKAAPMLTLVHDVSYGGLEAAIAEAAAHSGIAADVDLPEPAHGGQMLLACAPEYVERLGTRGLQQIGTV